MEVLASKTHPATEWAQQTSFDETQVDCTIAVVLKILDNKCKMHEGEKAAVMHVYDVVKNDPGKLFDTDAHRLIELARRGDGEDVASKIHELRLYAEANIPKPVMKAYKAVLREGLFG
jgi:hypothetical protein